MWSFICSSKYKLWRPCIIKNSLSTVWGWCLAERLPNIACGSRQGSVCASRTEVIQKINIRKSLAAVIHQNKRNAADISEKAVHPSLTYHLVYRKTFSVVHWAQALKVLADNCISETLWREICTISKYLSPSGRHMPTIAWNVLLRQGSLTLHYHCPAQKRSRSASLVEVEPHYFIYVTYSFKRNYFLVSFYESEEIKLNAAKQEFITSKFWLRVEKGE